MAIVKSVEKVQITLNNVTEPVTTNLSKGQDETQCIPFHTARWAADPTQDFNDQIYFDVQIIDNAGTAAVNVVAASRTETTSQIIEVFVVEFDTAINVQQVDVTTMGETTTSVNITVSDVTSQTSAFFFYCPDGTGTADDDFDNSCIRAFWNGASTTFITLQRRATGGTGIFNGTLYVVDCDSSEFIVEHAEIDRATANTDLSDTVTISTTVAADTFLIHSFNDSQQADDIYDSAWHADLQNTTTARIQRGISGTPASTESQHNIQVVECQNSEWSVQRNAAFTLTSASATDTITDIDQTKAVIIAGHLQGGLSVPRDNSTAGNDKTVQAFAVDFSANDTVRAQRQSGTLTDSVIAYEVVEFALTGGATSDVNFSGSNRGIMRGVGRGVG